MEIPDNNKLPEQNYSLVCREGKWYMVNYAGVEVFTFEKTFVYMSLLRNGLIKVKHSSNGNASLKYGVINLNEEVLVEHNYDYIEMYNGYIVCNNLIWEGRRFDHDMEEWCYGCEVESTIYSQAGKKLKGPNAQEWILLGVDSTTLKPYADYASFFDQDFYETCFKNGLPLPLRTNGKVAFISSTGNLICPPIYDGYDLPLDEGIIGIAVVRLGNLYGLIDSTGNEILPVKFNDILLLSSNKFEVELNSRYYLYDIASKSFTETSVNLEQDLSGESKPVRSTVTNGEKGQTLKNFAHKSRRRNIKAEREALGDVDMDYELGSGLKDDE